MCGIFALLNNNEDKLSRDFIVEQFAKSQSRGPDNSVLNLSNDIFLGFHRLCINGLNDDSNQPFLINGIELICNGEIYNYKALFNNIKYKATTGSDCEIIIYLYELYGMEYTLNVLDGVFAFILIDHNIDKIFVSRDPCGVRPLYYLYNPDYILNEDEEGVELFKENNKNNIIFGSEIKQLTGFCNKFNDENKKDGTEFLIKPVIPGEFMCFQIVENGTWNLLMSKSYNSFPMNNFGSDLYYKSINIYTDLIKEKFLLAIKKRVETTDRPIACLLSGGLDSSIVTSLVKKFYNGDLETYSIGLNGSADLYNAKLVAEYLGTTHTEIIVTEEDFFDSIPFVIKAIESYDTTTVRASVGNYLVCKYISENSEAKVIFNGDGADELMGGYIYMQHADNHLEFDKECKGLLSDIHFFDVLRSDRCISDNGLEPRTPFLDRDFVKTYLSIPSNIRFDTNQKQEKFLFRKAFEGDYLPNEILWRRKEAFSDGVSSMERSWYTIIEERVAKQTSIEYNLDTIYDHNEPQTLEQLYYRTIFESYYKNLGYTIPYFWMPKYVNATDSSARTLDIYNDHSNNQDNVKLLVKE